MRERMLAGEAYRPDDPELAALRLQARRLTQRYAQLDPADAAGQAAVLGELLQADAREVKIEPPFSVDYGCHITFAGAAFINFGGVILDVAPVRIGHRFQAASHVQLLTATHPLAPEARASGWESGRPITIGDDVWLGGGAIVLPGVTIGHRAVIGAGSVVTKDVPDDALVVGNPGRVMRKLRE
ncbi:MAG: maltose O-acetyltransferase [Puniceicoccaceae bacterium 5H]|nr:MAG: maltose O-acetyltransferase [Puniceicoccaceae bacterium 5H]